MSSALAIAANVALHAPFFVGQLARATIRATAHEVIVKTVVFLGRWSGLAFWPSSGNRSWELNGEFLLDSRLLFQVALDGLSDGVRRREDLVGTHSHCSVGRDSPELVSEGGDGDPGPKSQGHEPAHGLGVGEGRSACLPERTEHLERPAGIILVDGDVHVAQG